MSLKQQIEDYKTKHRNGTHTFKNGDTCQRLHQFLDEYYKDAVKEYKQHGTSERAETLKKLLR